MDKANHYAWRTFIKNMLIYTTLCFATGISVGYLLYSAEPIPGIFFIGAFFAVLCLIPATTSWLSRPPSIKMQWPSTELTKIMATEVVLGLMAGAAFCSIVEARTFWRDPPLKVNYCLFLLVLTAYHKGESLFVLMYHSDEYSWHSYVIYHQRSSGYLYMMTAVSLEFFVECWLAYEIKSWCNAAFITVFGCLAVAGIVSRNIALHQAKSNFYHMIRYHHDPRHRLITTGIYSIDRHPSYVSYWLAVVGLLSLLKCPVALIVYPRLMLDFYRHRIAEEERCLVNIFGDEYRAYMKVTPNAIGYP